MKRVLYAAVAAAAVASVGLPVSASAAPPIVPPEGATCTFHSGISTCVQSIGFGTVAVQVVDDTSCPSGKAEERTETSTTETTTTLFRGTHQLGEPQTVRTTTSSTSRSCVGA